jgi:hypothetical protein
MDYEGALRRVWAGILLGKGARSVFVVENVCECHAVCFCIEESDQDNGFFWCWCHLLPIIPKEGCERPVSFGPFLPARGKIRARLLESFGGFQKALVVFRFEFPVDCLAYGVLQFGVLGEAGGSGGSEDFHADGFSG